jgi:catechol 2,3-dioxygenase-like lactoylglutathione lyase family enzyme
MVVDDCIASPSDSARGLSAALVQHVADRHLGAGFDHQPRGFRTYAARRAGDEGDLAIETVHPIPPRSRSSLPANAGMMPRRLPKRIENMNIERLDHLVLTVADIARTCEFYTRVLGMEVVTFGEGRTALRFGQQKINLHPADNIPGLVADKPTPGSGDLCFITKVPLAEVTAHLNQCGVPIVAGPGPRAGAIGTIQSVYIRDPDENLVEISNY